MNHVDDIAYKIEAHLNLDLAIHQTTIVQGDPAEGGDYPNRDGAWHVYLVDTDGRAFKATVMPVDQLEAYKAIDEAGPFPSDAVR